MPTILRTAADLASTSSREVAPCARIASLNWAPIDFTGFSAFMALCITTERSFQRIAVSADAAGLQQVLDGQVADVEDGAVRRGRFGVQERPPLTAGLAAQVLRAAGGFRPLVSRDGLRFSCSP